MSSQPSKQLLRSVLLRGSSISAGALAMMVAATPAQAQLANLGAALGHPVGTAIAPPRATGLTPVTTPTMVEIAARHAAYQARLNQQVTIVANANAAARAAVAAAQQSINNGIANGALKPVDIAKQNTSALTIWVGASQPTQTDIANPTDGITTQVDVNQTQSRALLSWDSFNVGPNTLLNFNQQGHNDWVVVNRVVGGINPQTGLLDPTLGPTPTQILGRIKADGTVFILNRSGVMFGAHSQVDLHSLVASSLELGQTIVRNTGSTAGYRRPSLDDLNSSFLQNGLFPSDHVGLLGNIDGETHGAVDVAAGAQIRSTGGFVILAAPKVSMSGEINPTKDTTGKAIQPAAGSQVSLVAGDYVDASTSTGADDAIDPYVRGLVLTSLGGGTIDMRGSINTPEGYTSLVTDPTGTIDFSGVISATTSVARNGKISLIGGTVNFLTRPILDAAGNILKDAAGNAFSGTATMTITPDLSGATIPQAADSIAAFKSSQIDIGNYDTQLADSGFGQLQTVGGASGLIEATLLPTLVNIGANSTIYAPGADVNIGGTANGDRYLVSQFPDIGPTGITLGANAVIDVSGLDAVQVAAERNQLVISPAKKNELRDTPVYRDPKTDGTFTLNGATLYIDPRLSGIRDDGVAWVGSPLIEAGSLADQIGITAPELMTKGGNVTLATMGIDPGTAGMVQKPLVNIDPTATIDFSGGWVSYQAGQIRTSQLITSDGRVVDIGSASPNDTYVGLLDSFVEALPQLSTPYLYSNALQTSTRYSPAYSEGHDAGSLNISAPTANLNANLFGQAVAGERQILDAQTPTAKSGLAGDPRLLQAAHGQLPSGGLLNFSTDLGGSILVGGPDVQYPGLIHILDSTINNAGLSGLVLQTSGAIAFAKDSDIDLRTGGDVVLTAGRAISFNGTISAPAGSIDALTYGNRLGDLFDVGDDLPASGIMPTTTPAWLDLFVKVGAPLSSDQGWFDISVNSGAVLSTRGLWTNDLLVTDGLYTGGAYTSGGSVTLAVAPHIVAYTDATQTHAIDLSGSIEIASGSLLDVSGGGFISRTGAYSFDGKGGDVTLTDETAYFQLVQANSTYKGTASGVLRFNSDLTTFNLTPVTGTNGGYDSAVVPDELRSHVDIADGTIRSFGFQGGGTFTLTTPDLNFGSSGGTGTDIPLSFLADTGFGTLNLTAWNTTFIDNVFDNGRTGKTALLSTEIVKIGQGETLDLTQSILPSLLSAAQLQTMRGQVSGTDISRLDTLKPTNQLGDFYNRPANLILGGLTELDVLSGTIIGAPGATITVPKLLQAGTIDIRGGSITQQSWLPANYVTPRSAFGVGQQTGEGDVDPVAALAEIFGPANADGLYSETAFTALPGFTNVTNRDFLAKVDNDHQIYYLGRLAQDQGIVFAANSKTDLSGAVLLDPLAPSLAGTKIRSGRLVDGGTIIAEGRYLGAGNLFQSAFPNTDGTGYQIQTGNFTPARQSNGLTIDAAAGATIDISGAKGFFDLPSGSGRYTATPVWTNGGRLAGLGGGDVSQALIFAAGGTANAQGGEFDWYNPVLRQSANSALPEGLDAVGNIVSADQLMAAGFDSFVARGALSTLGDVDLDLGLSFILKSPDSLGTSDSAASYYSSTITGTGDLSITAPHVVLSSITQFISNLPEWGSGDFGDHTLTIRAQAAVGTGASFDIMGAIGLDAGFDQVNLSSQGDIRLIGVQPIKNTLDPTLQLQVPSLSGGIVASGRLAMQAREIYATTGTGNLLRDPTIKGDAASVYTGPFLIASLAHDTTGTPTISFLSEPGTTPQTPYSAGSYVQVLGENIFQGGALYAPIGRIDLGSRTGTNVIVGRPSVIATKTLTLANGSITSVSGDGLNIPYGTTIDLTDEYFSPTLTSPLTGLPAAQLGLSAGTITTDAGATVNASGGGSLYAYEFVSGTGGSRDLLSRFNTDAYSSLNGYQYADGRQVYAILPANSPELAAIYDPLYSSDYAALYGSEVGKTVTLDAVAESAPGKNDGIAGGQYILLPAKYALLPGASRLVEDTGATTPLANQSVRDVDGSVHVGGVFGIAGTQISDPLRKSFTVQSQAVFGQYSLIKQTDASTQIENTAIQNGIVVPRLPNDAAKIVIDPGTGLTIGNTFLANAKSSPSGAAGRGSQVDILGSIINIVSSDANAGTRGVSISTGTLANIDAASLLIGGSRTDNADGSTSVNVTASEIHVANFSSDKSIAGQQITLSAPEVLLAVTGENSILEIANNAAITATGTLGDTRTGVYDLTTPGANSTTVGSYGAFLRIANGPERFVDRIGDTLPTGKNKVDFSIGTATLTGQTLSLDSSDNLDIDAANFAVNKIALSSDTIVFSTRTFGLQSFFVISPELEAKLAAIDQVTLLSPNAIGFTPAQQPVDGSASHIFKNLVIDAPGIRAVRPTAGKKDTDPITIGIEANNVTIRNSFGDLGGCTKTGALACATTGNGLIINASGSLTLGSGTFRTYGFESTVNGNSLTQGSVGISALGGVYYSGKGSLELNNARLDLITPFIAELGMDAVPKSGAVHADYTINTSNTVRISSAGTAAATPQGAASPGAHFAIGSLTAPAGSLRLANGNLATDASLTVDGTLIRATAGTIALYGQQDVSIQGGAQLSAQGYQKTFGKDGDPDQVTVTANAGAISLVAKTGDLNVAAGTVLNLGATAGNSGSLALYASEGSIDLNGTINASAPNGGGDFFYDSGKSSFALTNFVTNFGSAFNGDVSIRSGAGDLALAAGNAWHLASLNLTADGGAVSIDRTIDTSGINGGDISLYGQSGVSLGSNAKLDSHAIGYAVTDTRQASAGDITLGVGANGAIDVASGAVLDLSATRPEARLVAKQQIDPTTQTQITSYTYVEGDQGGILELRAPVIKAGNADTVDVTFAGSVTGARDISLIGYKNYDLAAIAADGDLTGVSVSNGVATIDPSKSVAGKSNFLTDENSSKTIPYFIQHFDISAANANLGSLVGMEVFHERAGVDISYSGDIVLASSLNLGAGYITDYAAASSGTNPDLVLSPLSAVEGKPVYEVVAGHEADLFQNYVHMIYRTGTGANTGGEAGQFTFRAGGDLDIKGTITDGFFNFADQTDAAYLTYQLGGGTLLAQPTYSYQCAAGACGNMEQYPSSDSAALPKQNQSIGIVLSGPDSTLINIRTPYSDTANAASAYSQGTAGGGDPYGGASLFPLLADGSAASSSDIRLVGGADQSLSANPLHVDRGSNGNVIVEGGTSYTLKTDGKANVVYSGDGLLNIPNSPTPSLGADDISGAKLAADLGITGPDALTTYTRVAFGNASSLANQLLIDKARDFVAAHPGQARLLGTSKAPTGIATTLELAAEFLKSSNALDLLAGALAGTPGAGVGNRFLGNDTVNVRTMVRTGTGSIAIAAASDVDLTNGDPVLRTANGGKTGTAANPAMQLGGTAVYTAGHVVNPQKVTAIVAGTNQTLTVDPTKYLPSNDLQDTSWQPDNTGQLQANPQFATGGGSISVEAGHDVLGRRDVWREGVGTNQPSQVGAPDQPWRVGEIGADYNDLLGSTYIRINAQQFSSGIGALGGGDVDIRAGNNISEMTIALDTTLASADIGDSFGAMIFGGGNLDVVVGGNVDGGRFDIARGTANISAGEDIGSLGYLAQLPQNNQPTTVDKGKTLLANLPEIRLTDTALTLSAGGSISLAKVGALGLGGSDTNSTGFLTANSALVAQSYGDFTITGGAATADAAPTNTRVLPATLDVTSIGGDIDLGGLDNFLYPSVTGQLSLIANGTVKASAIDLDDGDASYLPGLYSAYEVESSDQKIIRGRNFGMPGVFANTSDERLRLYHNANITHLGDTDPARILVGGSLNNLTVYSAKQMRIGAGEDILNMIFVGQNVNPDDVTRIVAGRDITGTSNVTSNTGTDANTAPGKRVFTGNYFALGGPGDFYIEAGRNLGPFLNSATIASYLFQAAPGTHLTEPVQSVGTDSYAGGILAVGNDFNPWLAPKSADIYALFGVSKGMDFDALRETYLDPANVGALPGDLFEQNVDSFGNKTPDRSRPIYGPKLIAWMQANEAGLLQKTYGTTDVTYQQAYDAFAAMPELTQRRFLLDGVYFNELAAPSDPNGNSYLQYVRGYRAVDALFPASLGYTSNVLDGSSNGGDRVFTGNLDLRLAAIETTRDSQITLLGPGGDALLGSVVRTSAQAASLAYMPQIFGSDFSGAHRPALTSSTPTFEVASIPIGYEGVLTLRGGAIHSFTDGDLRLNQSRLFTQDSGDIVLWSSNGDLNAGQGPKSAANVPPIVLRFNPNGGSEVDSSGAVVGAGIAGFAGILKRDPITGLFSLVSVLDDPDVAAAADQLKSLKEGETVTINGKIYKRDAPAIFLLAPAGTVDAGDAGVRASGDIFVAAAQVANADNFKVGGTAVGIPSLTTTQAPALPASAASALAANVFQTNRANAPAQPSRILVDVLGYFNSNDDDCLDDDGNPKANCKPKAQ